MSDPLDRSLHGVAIYNPRLLNKAELIGFFVARQQELERLTEALRREAKAQPQHHLIVGARGMGKTTLLNRLRYAIEDDEELASACLGLVFPEEQYNVVCLADFWLNCVDALADTLETTGRLGLLEGLDEEIERIQALQRKDDRGRRALDLLCRLSDKLERRLVLLVDNVDIVLDRLEDEDWALREVLSSEARIQMIGATSAPLESQYRHDKAFYDFFRVHHIEGLDDEETFTVLRRLAETTGHDDIARLLDEEPGRVKTVRLMAGGNPRTLVMLFSVLAQGTDGDVRTDIERILDQCTPLYKHRLEALPMQAQQILDALAKHWDPATAAEIARATHLPVNAVSAQLDRLSRDGTIEKVPLPATHRQGFLIAERFFNIWCLMRASRRIRKRLGWLVKFLRLMFGTEELKGRARRHLTVRHPPNSMRHAEFGFALADLVEDAPLRIALETQSVRALCTDATLRRLLPELLDPAEENPRFSDRMERIRLLAEAREAVMAVRPNSNDWDPIELWKLMSGFPFLTTKAKHTAAFSLKQASHADIADIQSGMQKLQKYLSGRLVPEDMESLARVIRDGDIDTYHLDRDELEAMALTEGTRSLVPCILAIAIEANRSRLSEINYTWLSEEIKHSPSLLPRLVWARHALANGHSRENILACLSEIADSYTWGANGFNHLGLTLESLGYPDRAEEAYRKAIGTEPKYGKAWINLAYLLHRRNRHLDQDTIVRRQTTTQERHTPNVHTLIIDSMAQGNWSIAEQWITELAQATEDGFLSSLWSGTLEIFAEVVKRNLVSEARALLTSVGVAERWEPLVRALEIVEDQDLASLERLAPEMRAAVRLVLARISPQILEEPAPSPTKRRRPTKKT